LVATGRYGPISALQASIAGHQGRKIADCNKGPVPTQSGCSMKARLMVIAYIGNYVKLKILKIIFLF